MPPRAREKNLSKQSTNIILSEIFVLGGGGLISDQIENILMTKSKNVHGSKVLGDHY